MRNRSLIWYFFILSLVGLFFESSHIQGVEIRLHDGTLIKGEFQQETLKIKNESGVIEVRIDEIAEISLEGIDSTAPSSDILKKGLDLWIQAIIKFYDEKQNKAFPLLSVASYQIREKIKKDFSPELLPDGGPFSFLRRFRSIDPEEGVEKKETPKKVFIYEFDLETLRFKALQNKPSGWAVFRIYQEKTPRGVQQISTPHEKLTGMEIKEGDLISRTDIFSENVESLYKPVRLAFIQGKESWILRKVDIQGQLSTEKWEIPLTP